MQFLSSTFNHSQICEFSDVEGSRETTASLVYPEHLSLMECNVTDRFLPGGQCSISGHGNRRLILSKAKVRKHFFGSNFY